MNFITLTGYYPEQYRLLLEPGAIVGFHPNVTNPKSRGSVVHVAGATAAFQVLEHIDEISALLAGEMRRG